MSVKFDKDAATSDDKIEAAVYCDLKQVKKGRLSKINVQIFKNVQLVAYRCTGGGMYGGGGGHRRI